MSWILARKKKLLMAARPAGSGITFIGGQNGDGFGSSVSITKPSGAINGDNVYAFVVVNAASRTITLGGTGWSQVFFNNSASPSFGIYKKTVSGDAGDFSATISGADVFWVGCIVAFRNVTDVDVVGSLARAASATSTASSITATARGRLLLFGYVLNNGATVSTPPAGMDLIQSLPAYNPGFRVYSLDPSEVGATGTKSIVWSTSTTVGAILMQLDSAV